MTGEEIEKALEERAYDKKYADNGDGYWIAIKDSLSWDTLDYIKRLKAEIASLTGAVDALKTDNDNLIRTLKECDEELEERVIEADENAALAMEQKLRADKLEEKLKTARKETAEEILQEWYNDITSMGEDGYYVKRIAEKYGVEVEE